jgi:hypothetical protein
MIRFACFAKPRKKLKLSLSLYMYVNDDKGKQVEASWSSSGSEAMNGCGSGVTGVQQAMAQNEDGVAALMTGSSDLELELGTKAVSDTKSLATDLCHHFYTLGWLSGTGGSFTLRVHHDAVAMPSQLIVMSPSGNSVTPSPHLSLSLSTQARAHAHANACVYGCTRI